MTSGDVPAGDSMYSDYQGRTGQSEIPVQKEDAPVEDSLNPVDSATADSGDTLVRDGADAIDESNIMGGHTGGLKPSGEYRKPGNEEGLSPT
ncbi:hypothetical protein ABVK25_001944 [Lepraria finkii]|uniref:Uncharacterized protein n=1 Tax=Lepraria finkii TaxID=1340010 RepID=A0ABR4BIA7_9LECA